MPDNAIPLTLILYVDPAFKTVRPPDPPPPLTETPLYDDPLEIEKKVVRISNAPMPSPPKPLLLPTLKDSVLPTNALVLDHSSRNAFNPSCPGKLLLRNNKYLRAILAPEFPTETWMDIRFKLKKPDRQVAALKCFVKSEQAEAFLEKVRSKALADEGIRLHVPPAARKSLLALGLYTFRPGRTNRSATIVSKEARRRRNHALYIYTGSRKRGQMTSGALAMDHACKELLQARLHIPQQGRVTAYCYEISFDKPLESIDSFVRGALQLRATDPLVRITARSPLAIGRLEQYITTLDPLDAKKVQAILGPFKSLEPELKWTKTGPAPREAAPKSTFVFDTKQVHCTDNAGSRPLDVPLHPTQPDVDPSPRQTESRPLDVAVVGMMRPEKREPLEAVSFVVFPSDSPGGIVPTVRLKQLLDALPNRASFVLTSYGDTPAAALKVNLDDEEAVATFLRTTRLLQDNGFRFVVQPFEAETWFSKFLDETFEPEDVATMVTPCWDRALPGAGDRA